MTTTFSFGQFSRDKPLMTKMKKSSNLLIAIFGVLCLAWGSQSANAATLIFSDGFESGNFLSWGENHAVQITSNPVHSGTRALQYCYGCLGGGGNTLRTFNPTKRVYLSFYWYFPPGHNFNFAPGRHGFRIKGTSGGMLDTELWSDPNMIIFGNCVAGSCTNETDYNGVDANYSAQPNHWFHVEVDIQWNLTAGSSDGFFKVWIDGVQKINSTGKHFSNADERFNELWITSNDDNCVGGASACTYYIDDVQLWDSPPTTGIPPADAPPPSPSLRIQ